jgi:hypothetical protein
VALRPINLDQERQAFFQSDYKYDPQFEYSTLEPSTVLEKYKDGSDLFLSQVGLSVWQRYYLTSSSHR